MNYNYICGGILCFTDGKRSEIEDNKLYLLRHRKKGIETKKEVMGKDLSATIRNECDGCFGEIFCPIKQGVRV